MADDLSADAFEHAQSHSLEVIFEHYVDPVYRFLYARVGNREDAEDLTSQVFVKAAHQLDGSRSSASVASWLFTVARTVLADHWRRFYRSPAQLTLDELVVADRPHDENAQPEQTHSELLVEAVLRSLPPRYRRTLELRFLHGYSVDEAAAEMNVTSGNLKILQHRALAKAAALGLPEMSTAADRNVPRESGTYMRTPEGSFP